MTTPTRHELAKALGQSKPGRIQVAPAEDRTWNGIVFASKREMDHWKRFEGMERCGAITNLRRQIKYPLHATTPGGFKVEITHYRADIVCEDREGKTCIYDPKGMKTDRWKLISKWMEVEYGIRVVEL